MKKPKTVKGWLKMLLMIADSSAFDLKGEKKLTEEELSIINKNIADLQNALGDSEDLGQILVKFNLVWK